MIMTVDMDYRVEKTRWPSWEWQEVILADGTQCRFHDCGEIRCVGLPDTVTRIESEAFSGCEGLRIISLQGMTEIERGAFCACHPDLTICAPAGGEAQRYAGEYGFRFEAIGQAASGMR